MLNGLSWAPSTRKRRSGLRQANSKAVALSEFTTKPQNLALPFWNSRAPRRARLKLRASLLSPSRRPPLANAVLNSLLPLGGLRRINGAPTYKAPSTNNGRAPSFSAPVYLRTSKDSRPTRAVLRLFYMYISNPTPTVITFTKALALWNLTHCGSFVKGPFSSI